MLAYLLLFLAGQLLLTWHLTRVKLKKCRLYKRWIRKLPDAEGSNRVSQHAAGQQVSGGA